MKKLIIASLLSLCCSPCFAAVELDADANGATDIGKGGTNATTAANARTALGVPATAATLVGDCTVGPCLDGSTDGGNLIKLWAGTGSYWTALQGGAPAANRSWRLPILAPPSAGETNVMTMDEYGAMAFIDKPSTTGYVLSSTDAGVLSWVAPGSGSMVYPGAGIPLSTGSAWGTSYSLTTLAAALDGEAWTFTGAVDMSGASSVLMGPISFEGATANDYETTFSITDPTADRTITVLDANSTIPAATSVDASGKILTAGLADADLTTLAEPGNWKVFYSNGSGAQTALAIGASGTVLKSNGTANAPTWETDATGAGLSGLATSSITGDLTLTKTGTTARTVTFPDAAITVARSDAAQTLTGNQTLSDGSKIIFDESATDPNDADVELSATDGVLKFAAANGANNEDLTIDLDQTSNTAILGSSTGLTLITTGSIPLNGAIKVVGKSSDYTIGTDNANEAYGAIFFNTDASTRVFTLPSAAAGMSVCVRNLQGVAQILRLDAGSGDYIVKSTGARTSASGEYYGATADAKNQVCVVAYDATDWYVTSEVGTWTEE